MSSRSTYRGATRPSWPPPLPVTTSVDRRGPRPRPNCPSEPATWTAHVYRDRRVHSGPMALSTEIDVAALIADTEAEILRLVSSTDPATAGVYEMCRYHLGLDGSGSSGKRMRPLLGLLAYASLT